MPSSPFLMENLANRDCIREASFVVELGPGAGGTTCAILSQMRADSQLLAIEKTEAFLEALQQIDDPRLTTVIGDASDLADILQKYGNESPDVVVSGIPFSSIPAPVAKAITRSIHQTLKPGGTFIAYQMRNDITRLAEPYFGTARTDSVALNLPPLHVYAWRKMAAGGFRSVLPVSPQNP
ncbi:MAG: methyltransferase domain-containing protein [Pirellulaceae bacterium]